MTNKLTKGTILANLTNWCFDPLGDLVMTKLLKDRVYKDENHYYFRLYQNDETNPNWRTEPKINDLVLDYEDYQEIKEAMIEEIKQSPRDWKIENEEKFTIIKHKSGRKHWKSEFSEGFKKGFREDEWREIEDALSINNQGQDDSLNPEIPSNQQQQVQEEQSSREIIFTFIIVAVSASLMIAGLFAYKSTFVKKDKIHRNRNKIKKK